jgi:hypothetical protein
MVGMSDEPSAGIPPLAGEDHACTECGLSYATFTLDAARAIIGSLPDSVDAAVGPASGQDLTRRPAPERWSALEYLFHLRDVCVTYTIRVHRARTARWLVRQAAHEVTHHLEDIRHCLSEVALGRTIQSDFAKSQWPRSGLPVWRSPGPTRTATSARSPTSPARGTSTATPATRSGKPGRSA